MRSSCYTWRRGCHCCLDTGKTDQLWGWFSPPSLTIYRKVFLVKKFSSNNFARLWKAVALRLKMWMKPLLTYREHSYKCSFNFFCYHCVLYCDFMTVIDVSCSFSFHLQTRPVPFTVRGIVTSSDIEFNVQDIDFGFCTVLESVRRTVTITNKSVLPQPFGFCGVPDVSELLR